MAALHLDAAIIASSGNPEDSASVRRHDQREVAGLRIVATVNLRRGDLPTLHVTFEVPQALV